MFLKLLQFEWKYLSRQIGFYVLIILSILLGIAAFIDMPTGIVKANAPYRISFFIGILSIGCIFPIQFFSVKILLRDRAYDFEELIFSTSLSKFQYFLCKFLSVFMATLFIMSSSIVGFYCGQFIEDAHLQPGIFEMSHYFWPWFLLLLPNCFICAVILFSATLLTRKVVITYITGVLLLSLFWMASFYINSPLIGGRILAGPAILNVVALMDFFGLTAFFEQTQFWTIYEKNSLLITFSGYFLWNRILWINLSVIGLVLAYSLFSFRKKSETVKRKRGNLPFKKLERKPHAEYQPISPIINTLSSQIKAISSLLRIDVQSLFKSKAFLAFLLIWIAINIASMHFSINGEEEFGGRYPTTELLVGLISEPAALLGLLLILYYSGVLLWKNRDDNFYEILESTPVTNGIFFCAKYMAILLVILLMLSIGIIIGVAFQIARDYYQFNWLHYLSVYYFSGLPLLLTGLFAIFVQVVIPRKYVAMLVAGVILLFFGQMAPALGIEESMLRFLHFPKINHRYSDLTGYGQYATPFHAFAVYWSAMIGVMSILSIWWWKVRKLNKRKTLSSKVILAGLTLLFVISGSHIYYNTYILQPFSFTDKDDFNEQYERKFKQYENLPIPQVVDVKTQVDIFPKERRYRIEGHYLIENLSDQNIKDIFVCTRQPLQSLIIGNSELVMHDSSLRSYLFRLNRPLKPREQVSLAFKLEKQVTGLATSMTILTNGSYIPHNAIDPLLGYANFLEINNPVEREKRGLPKREKLSYKDPHLLDGGKFTTKKVNYEAIVSTSADQMAITSGKLIRKWTENGRNYFQYKSASKIRRNMTYISTRYDKKTYEQEGVDIEMYYHPNHFHNIEAMAQIAKVTLDYTNDNFGPYPHDYLRIAEVASGRGFGGQAMPGVISMSEKSMYTKDVRNPEKGINVVARRTIHEIAHQWWAHQLTPKRVAGASLLTEALCKYTEAVVLEKLYGKAMVRKLTDYTLRRYFTGRSYARASEPPLFLTAGQSYLGYSKGYMVLYALKELLGADVINQALQNILRNHKGELPTATSLDLINELYAVAPPIYHSLIDDWMKQVITYDLKVKESSLQQLSNGQYEVTLRVFARRFEMQASGEEKEVPINEPIQIGLFAKHPNEMKKGETPLYFQNHWISQPDTILKITSDVLPYYIGVDPYLTRLDKDRQDNLSLL